MAVGNRSSLVSDGRQFHRAFTHCPLKPRDVSGFPNPPTTDLPGVLFRHRLKPQAHISQGKGLTVAPAIRSGMIVPLHWVRTASKRYPLNGTTVSVLQLTSASRPGKCLSRPIDAW